MTDITHIVTTNVPGRVETGPVQFNDDWPGVFIRGDNAAYLAYCLELFINGTKDFITESQVRILVDLLKSCRV